MLEEAGQSLRGIVLPGPWFAQAHSCKARGEMKSAVREHTGRRKEAAWFWGQR